LSCAILTASAPKNSKGIKPEADGVTVAVIVRAALDAADEPLAVVIDLRISLLKPFPFDPPARQ